MRLEVRLLGDPVLRQKAEPVSAITADMRKLIGDMFDTMYAEEGVGLAAPQVGISERIIVVDPHDDETEPFALINPEILDAGAETEKNEEGCLSIPGIRDLVERSVSVRVRGLTETGEVRELEAEGLLSRILQHEIDHLNGVLFLDRLSPLKRSMAMKKWQKTKPEGAR
jgi:peptide deformylase